MLEYHSTPQPATCDVCLYSVEHDLNCGYEHARARVATALLLEDLENLEGESAALSALALTRFGKEPGPVHPLEPRHWYWAMFHASDIRISWREPGAE